LEKGSWTATVAHSYLSGYSSNLAGVTPTSYTTRHAHDRCRGTYEFKNGVWRSYGKGLRIGLGVANLEDAEPPFFNNIYGFNGGLHGRWAFGRTYEISFIVPLDSGAGPKYGLSQKTTCYAPGGDLKATSGTHRSPAVLEFGSTFNQL